MTTRSKVLIAVSVPTLLAGVVVSIFTTVVLRYVVGDDVYILTTRYDPNGDAAYKAFRTYENLYPWTKHLVHHRNHFAMRFHYALGAFLVVLGAILIAWAIDRERLQRRLTDWGNNCHNQARGEIPHGR